MRKARSQSQVIGLGAGGIMMLLNVGLMYITEGRKALGSMMAGRPRSIFAMDNSCVAPLAEWAGARHVSASSTLRTLRHIAFRQSVGLML